MRAHIALVLTISMASPAVAETIAQRACVIDGDSPSRIRVAGVDAPEGGQICHDANETDYRCAMATEWAVTDRVTIKSEAVYLWLQDDSLRRTGGISGSGDTKRIDHDDSVWVGRIGVNFKLEGQARQPQ
jgi:endonuclease YncB( thermonuclease family)